MIYINGVPQGGGGSMTPAEIRDALMSLPEATRKFIISSPGSGEYKVFEFHRNPGTNIQYGYEDEPEP